MNLKQYKNITEVDKVKQPLLKNGIIAFFSGGFLGLIGQVLIDIYQNVVMLDEDESRALMSITIVFIASILTLIGVYKNLGKVCGAGLFLPTTGFANSVVSSSIEARHEGFILGVGSRIFSLAGSVITYGIVSAVILIIIKFLLLLIGVNLWLKQSFFKTYIY